jgi:hypothetical protein
MPQKARPDEKTILQALAEMAGYEDIRTSEDLGKLSESSIFSDWVLPAITGATAETEEYKPGALELALSIPVVGGSVKTGFKLAKKGAKKLSEAYKRSIRPKVLPEKDALLRLRETQFTDVSEMDEILTGLERQISVIEDVPSATRSVTQTAAGVARTPNQVAESIVREFGFSSDVTWNQARAIVADIGEDGWVRYLDDLRSIPLGERDLHLANFLAKYRTTIQITGQQASAAYKIRRFTSKMPDESMVISKGRHGQLTYSSTSIREGKSRISLKWGKPDRMSSGASLDFNITSKVDEAGKIFDEISDIHFFATSSSKRYAGRLMSELIKKIPEGAIINESSMTYDALYTLLRQSIRNNAKIVFHKTNPKTTSSRFSVRRKQSSAVSSLSPWSNKFNKAKELYQETGDPRHIDKAVDEIMDDMRGMISEYAKKSPGKVVGKPQLKAIKKAGEDYLSPGPDPTMFFEKGRFEYNFISIHKMSGIIAGAFGFKNKEEFMKFLSYNPESTEAQIFDNEFSL